MTETPSFAKQWVAVVLPQPMPPVSPILSMKVKFDSVAGRKIYRKPYYNKYGLFLPCVFERGITK
jgi:hypothetical protein